MSTFGAPPFQPGMTSDTYIPDQLIAGDLKIVTDSATITGGAALVRGTVLGQVTLGATTSAAKSGGNTGNGTFVLDATTPAIVNAETGTYTLRCITAAANGGVFRLESPRGLVLGDFAITGGAGGTVTISERIKGVITDGSTDFVVGDGFDITVAAGSLAYKKAVSTAVDGSAAPVTVLVDNVDASGGDVTGGIFLQAELNGNALTLGSGITLAAAKAALREKNIIIKSPVSASDPT